MNAYANVAKELKNGLEKNSILKKLLSLDVVILFASLGLQLFFWLLNQWVGWIIISDFIGLFHTIFYYTMIVGMVLTLANRKDQMLAAGCWAYAALQFISFLRQLVYRYNHYFNLSTLFVTALWVGLGLLVFFVSNPEKMPKMKKPAAPVPPVNNGGQWNTGAPRWNTGAPQQPAAPQ